MTTYRGDDNDRWEEVARFLRAHGDHGLTRLEADDEFGQYEGFACSPHEAQIELIPPIRAASGAVPALDPLNLVLLEAAHLDIFQSKAAHAKLRMIVDVARKSYARLSPESVEGGE